MKAFSSRNRLLLWALIVLLLVFGALAVRMILRTPPVSESEAPVVLEEPRLREVVLYFGNATGENLVPETREIEDCLEEADCIRSTVLALVSGPVTKLVPILPAHAMVRGVAVDGGTAVIDFSRELVTAHPGGSASELLTVYGVSNTLAENFPHVRQIQILVEGDPVESLKGHVDLSGPIQADFSFSRPPGESARELSKAQAGGEGHPPVPGRD